MNDCFPAKIEINLSPFTCNSIPLSLAYYAPIEIHSEEP